jgi:hypothetical protein
MALFTSKYELTFVDNSGRLNLFARMTKNAYEEVCIWDLAQRHSQRPAG